jgi:hypothetical protein
LIEKEEDTTTTEKDNSNEKVIETEKIEKDKETTNLTPKKNIPKTCFCKRRSIATGEEHYVPILHYIAILI